MGGDAVPWAWFLALPSSRPSLPCHGWHLLSTIAIDIPILRANLGPRCEGDMPSNTEQTARLAPLKAGAGSRKAEVAGPSVQVRR